jgi:hypothetical protein
MMVKSFIFKVLRRGYWRRKALLPAVPPLILPHLKSIHQVIEYQPFRMVAGAKSVC